MKKLLLSLLKDLFSWPMILFISGAVAGIVFTHEYTRGSLGEFIIRGNTNISMNAHIWREIEDPGIALLIIFASILLVGKTIYTIRKK